MSATAGRCAGHCCVRFTLGNALSPATLRMVAERSDRLLRRGGLHPSDERAALDMVQIAAMVRYQSSEYLSSATDAPPCVVGMQTRWAGLRRRPWPHRSATRHWFTCTHYDAASGDCAAYEQRPDMCRRHGVTYRCDHPGCKLVASLAPAAPAEGAAAC